MSGPDLAKLRGHLATVGDLPPVLHVDNRRTAPTVGRIAWPLNTAAKTRRAFLLLALAELDGDSDVSE